jgi:hypothetical protein
MVKALIPVQFAPIGCLPRLVANRSGVVRGRLEGSEADQLTCEKMLLTSITIMLCQICDFLSEFGIGVLPSVYVCMS